MPQVVSSHPPAELTLRRHELRSVQYLRALAAVGVVCAHACVTLFNSQKSPPPLQFGAAGVDLFFTISGFIMFYTTDGARPSPRRFYTRRFIRIFPLYFLATSAICLAQKLAPWLFQSFGGSPREYLLSIFFIPFYHRLQNGETILKPLIRQGWTLNYEVFFYAIYGCVLLLPRRWRLVALASVLGSLTLLGLLLRPQGAVLSTYTDPLILEFLFGAAIGYFFSMADPLWLRSFAVSFTACSLIIAGLSFGVHPGLQLPRLIEWGIPAASLVSLCLLAEKRLTVPKAPVFLLIGDSSYSLYLLHEHTLTLWGAFWMRHFNPAGIGSQIGFLLTGLALSIFVGIVSFHWVELPTTRFLTRHLLQKK